MIDPRSSHLPSVGTLAWLFLPETQSCLVPCAPGQSGSHQTPARAAQAHPSLSGGIPGASQVLPSARARALSVQLRHPSQTVQPARLARAEEPPQPDTAAPLSFLPVLCHGRACSRGQRWRRPRPMPLRSRWCIMVRPLPREAALPDRAMRIRRSLRGRWTAIILTLAFPAVPGAKMPWPSTLQDCLCRCM